VGGNQALQATAANNGINGTSATDGTHVPGSAPLGAAQPSSDLRLNAAARSAFAPREGDDATPSTTPPGRGEDMTQNQEENH